MKRSKLGWTIVAVAAIAVVVRGGFAQADWPLERFWAGAAIAAAVGVAIVFAVWPAKQPGGTIRVVGAGLAGWGVVVTALLLPDAEWRTRSIGGGTKPPRATIEIPTDPTQMTPVLYEQLLAYARDTTLLEFDSLTHRAWDERYLIIVKTVDTIIRPRGDTLFRELAQPQKLVGPRAKIVPERWAFRNSQADLGTGPRKGRIVARVWVDSEYLTPDGRRRPSGGYPDLQLPPGLSYLWVDQLDAQTDSSGVARLIIIPDNPQFGIRVDTLEYRFDRGGWQRHSRARWVFDMTTDPDSWNLTCPMGCCE